MFTRSKTKQVEAAAAVDEPVVEKRPAKETKATPMERKRKKSAEPEVAVDKKRKISPPPVRSEAAEGPKPRRSKRTSTVEEETVRKSSRRGQDKFAGEERGDDGDSMQLPGETETEQVEVPRDTTKIALPFADTPIIRRNKELRKGGGQGHRRSSIGMRGRRASSLIDSGTSNGTLRTSSN